MPGCKRAAMGTVSGSNEPDSQQRQGRLENGPSLLQQLHLLLCSLNGLANGTV